MNSPTKKLYICWDEDDMDGNCNILMTENESTARTYKYTIILTDKRKDPGTTIVGQITLE